MPARAISRKYSYKNSFHYPKLKYTACIKLRHRFRRPYSNDTNHSLASGFRYNAYPITSGQRKFALDACEKEELSLVPYHICQAHARPNLLINWRASSARSSRNSVNVTQPAKTTSADRPYMACTLIPDSSGNITAAQPGRVAPIHSVADKR